MRLLNRWLFLLTFSLSALCTQVFADYADNIALNQQRLEQLPTEDSDPDVKQQRERLQKIITAYQEATTFDKESAELRKELETYTERLNQLTSSLKQRTPSIDRASLMQQSISNLEQRQTLEQAKQLELEQQQEQLQNTINQSDQYLIKLREQLTQLKQTSVQLAENNNDLAEAQFAQRSAQIQYIQLQILHQPNRNNLDQARLDLLKQQIKEQNSLIEALQEIIQSKRQSETEEALEKLSNSKDSTQSPVIASLLKDNQTLGEQLKKVQQQSSQARQQRSSLESELTIVSQSYSTIQQELELSNQPLGIELRTFTRRLSQPISTSETKDGINELRLLNLNISRQLFSLEREQQLPDLSQGLQQQADALIDNKKTLLTRINDASSEAINELSQLLTIQEQINNQVRLGRELISQHLLWIPSIQPVTPDWPAEIINGVGPLVDIITPYKTIPLIQHSANWIPKIALWLGVVLLSIVTVRLYRRKAPEWANAIGHVVKDKFIHSFNMVWMPIVTSLPLPTAIYFIGHEILNAEAWPNDALIQLTNVLSMGLWIYLIIHAWLRTPYGLLAGHFAMPVKLCKSLRAFIHPLFWLGMPLVLLLLVTDQSNSNTLQSGIGRLAFISLATLVAIFWLAMLRLAPHIDTFLNGEVWWKRAQFWLSSLVVIHLLGIGVALFGYVFSGTITMLILLVLAGIIAATFIIFKLGNRWLLIEERHLAYERAKIRRNEILEAREKNEEIAALEENYIDVQTLSDQARVLLKTVTVIIFATLLWMLIKTVLPTLDMLDQIVLWGGDVDSAGSIISQAITLKNLLFSLVLISLCVLAAYNLPGLLELLVLRHITLAPGTSYAITSVTKYILIVVSIMVGASQLGLEWSKLQWLIAALGVGLGFGLQEIVANFVSGIIILFEKPMRIGDMVTVGGISGTVSRIQIRATTITDFDRKEVIIPNKTFVTDQLINWSLTDPITRVVILVGVAYGSDTKLAHKLLLEVANEHPRVLDDPAPNAFFLTFGASTLDFELRIFVNSLSDRLEVTHEINQAIDQRFKENGIEIAFPQMDVHLHRAPKKKS
ncbi:mechanosensitive ion channel domain-containing protein [Neptunomonas phycophila]|uniref:mechanosensitive ion channel domain-containing protein n=1 Tax=Neptunomonas phycophila TaxID=1572645 RepID=UPI0037351605